MMSTHGVQYGCGFYPLISRPSLGFNRYNENALLIPVACIDRLDVLSRFHEHLLEPYTDRWPDISPEQQSYRFMMLLLRQS